MQLPATQSTTHVDRNRRAVISKQTGNISKSEGAEALPAVTRAGAGPKTELSSQTGPAPEQDVASPGWTERELTNPVLVRGGHGLE
jgi:hypothetical protein